MTPIVSNTSLTLNAYLNPGATANRAIDGIAMQIGRGVLALFQSPLPSGPLAMPALLTFVNVTGGTCQQGSGATESFVPTAGAEWTAQMKGGDKAAIDLGDGYTLDIDENASEVVITNAETGEVTRIWGDPHVSIDGRHEYDFWGTTTFTLENGTKITINTEAAADNPNVFYAEKLTITKGDQAIVVDGVSELTKGDLSVSMSDNGQVLDALTRDGFVLNENATGSGWRSELTGDVATQADLDLTRPGALYGPDSTMPSLGELNQTLSTFLFFGFAGAMIDSSAGASARSDLRAFANLG